MTNQSAKEQVKAVLGITPKDEGTKVLKLVDVNEALSQIEEIVLGVIGRQQLLEPFLTWMEKTKEHGGNQEEYWKLYDNINRENDLISEQLKRWGDHE